MREDLKVAWRRLRNAPGFTAVAIVTLALAVGANTAIFAIADAVLFRSLPYGEPDRLFVLRMVDRGGFRGSGVPYELVAAIQQRHSGVERVALRSTTTFMSHPAAAGAEEVEMFVAAPDYFQVLGVRPFRGRLFEAEDVADGRHRVVLTYETWRARFGGDEGIIGRHVRLGTSERMVVGILPPRFVFPSMTLRRGDTFTGRAEFAAVAAAPDPANPLARSSVVLGGWAINAIVRLRPGVTREQAQAETDAILASLPAPAHGPRPRVFVDDIRDLLFPSGRERLVALMAAAGLVLLIACANLATMLMAKTQQREKELGVRMALGASRMRLLRPLVFETLIVAVAAAGVALVLSAATAHALVQELPRSDYGRAFVNVDARVGGFAFAAGVMAGLLFAVLPVWRAGRMDVQMLMRRKADRARRPFGGPLVAMEVMVAVVLVAGAATAGRALIDILNQPLGFNAENVATFRVRPGEEDARQFQARVIAALKSHPDVIDASAGSSRPFDRFLGPQSIKLADGFLPVAYVLPGYLEVLDVSVTDGQLPTSNTSASGLEPAVLTASAARRLFAAERPVGRTITIAERSAEVVAIVDDVTTGTDARLSWVYLVPRDGSGEFDTFIARTRGQKETVLAALRRAIVELAPPTEPVTARWLSESIGSDAAYRTPRFQTLVLGAFGWLALMLSAIGVFAVAAASVAGSTRELGVRLAIGATAGAVQRLVLRRIAGSMVIGLLAGAAVVFAVGTSAGAIVSSLAMPAADVIAAAAVTVFVAGLLAAYFPARRASRIDPIVVLRAE